MTMWKTTDCEANGISINYTRTGGNKPPIILLHGLMTNGLCWKNLADALEKEYDIILPDARGHGKSSAPEHGYFYEDHAKDVVGLIKALSISPPIVIGHSMGGMTAALLASRYPKILRGLILADPTFLSPIVQHEVWESDAAEQHRRILKMSLEKVIEEAHTRHPNRSSEIIELMAIARLQTSMNAFEVLTPPNPDYKQLVRTIEVPSLLIFGDKGVATPEAAEEIQHLNPNFQIEQIQNAGHGLQFDQPEIFAAKVKSFLHAVDNAKML